MSSFGVEELNPIAACIIKSENVYIVVLYKVSLISLSVYCLYRARNVAYISLVAWFLFLVMTALMFYWAAYSNQIAAAYHVYPVKVGGMLF